MKVAITTRVLYHDRLGALHRGRIADVPDRQAEEWLRRGWAERYETKVMRERPSMAVGGLSSASPAAPASPQTTSSESDSGGKTRRRRKSAASS